MSLVVQMDGLPANADANAVVLAVRKILQKLKIRFWVHDFTFTPETNTKKCKIEFFGKQEATKAIDRITSKPQTIMGVQCNLKITYVSDKNNVKKSDQESRRDRSRSPISTEEATINKELEQLKKEREELEKRKNELLKKKSSIDQKEAKEEKTSKDVPMHTKLYHSLLPKNTGTEVAILEQMKPLVRPHMQKRYYQNFMQRMHVEIRMRLAILQETNRLNESSTVGDKLKAYRRKYPKERDHQVIELIMSQIKQSFWPYRAKNKDGPNPEPFEYDESEEEEDNTLEQPDDNKNDVEMANKEVTTENAEQPATEVVAGDDKKDSEIVFEGGSEWNEEESKVAAAAS